MEFDLHLHTSEGSPCSRMPVRELVRAAKAQGLDGICITDHDFVWDPGYLKSLSREHEILVFGGMELSTSLGEVLIYGVEDSLLHLRDDPAQLKAKVGSLGGVMVAAHPLRRDFSLPHGLSRKECGLEPLHPEILAERPVFRYVDALEIYNGRSGLAEKAMAVSVAEILNLPGTGGSDAHSVLGIGGCVTVFRHPIKEEVEFLEQLRSGKYQAAKRNLRERKNWG
ncbi:MAG: PHP-associated domain-containing protein [Desulfitobacteriaceae bacterium]